MKDILSTDTISPELVERIKKHEGFRANPYRCTAGKLTIGYGRNLEDKGISRNEAAALLMADINEAAEQLEKHIPNVLERIQGKARKEVLVEMVFNMGIGGVMKFRKMLGALVKQDYDKAAAEMLDSRWASQVGQRAVTLANIMRNGR